MPQDTVTWVLGGVICAVAYLSSYVGVSVLPALASLEVQAAHAQKDTDKVAKQLELIRKELNEVNVKLARIESKL